MIVAGSGHRPDKLGIVNEPRYYDLAGFAKTQLIGLGQVEGVISGMALGWDQALAVAALDLGIPFVAAVPFNDQPARWREEDQRVYRWLLSQANQVEIVCHGDYAPHKMQVRNRWMVDRCDLVLALWDGSPGGTANCLTYAREVGCRIKNVWKEWTN